MVSAAIIGGRRSIGRQLEDDRAAKFGYGYSSTYSFISPNKSESSVTAGLSTPAATESAMRRDRDGRDETRTRSSAFVTCNTRLTVPVGREAPRTNPQMLRFNVAIIGGGNDAETAARALGHAGTGSYVVLDPRDKPSGNFDGTGATLARDTQLNILKVGAKGAPCELELTDGQKIAADTVIFAPGPGADPAQPNLDIPVSMGEGDSVNIRVAMGPADGTRSFSPLGLRLAESNVFVAGEAIGTQVNGGKPVERSQVTALATEIGRQLRG